MLDLLRTGPRRALLAVLAMFLTGAFLGPVGSATAAEDTPTTKIATGGFGDSGNSYAWSMAWFNGKLYVGTARHELCVEGATYDFYFPGKGYKTAPAPGVTCPEDRYDLDLQAQIWQYTPETDVWKMVYQAPADIPNPRAEGKFVSRDIGYRGMQVFTDSTGTTALYVGAVSADEYIPELAKDYPPRMLRTTDGETFTALEGGPGTIQNSVGKQRPIGFRAFAIYHKKLYVTASGGLTGDGVVLEVQHPERAKPTYVQVSPASIQVFEMKVFDGNLYLGAGSATKGYSVWRTNLRGNHPTFKQVVKQGAGRGAVITSVVSMQNYRGKLYVGASGWTTLFPSSELIRINKAGRWKVVVGNPRIVNGSQRFPLSGLTDGFGNIFNAHFWRMSRFQHGLYLGTNDWSWTLQTTPVLGPLLKSQFGFDMYGTCDGTTWTTMTTTAFGGGQNNFGLRTLTHSDSTLYVGSANHADGTSAWTSTGLGCGTTPPDSRTTGRAASASARPLVGLQSVGTRCGTALSWQGQPGREYVVLRTDTTTIDKVPLRAPRPLPNGYRLGSAPLPDAAAKGSLTVQTKPRVIGTTDTTSFVDTTGGHGTAHVYTVQASDGSGQVLGTVQQTGTASATAERRAC